MSNAIENNTPKANNYGDQKSNVHATTQYEIASSQPSAASSPFNSFIIEYEIGSMDLQPRSPKEPNVRLKNLTMSGEMGQLKSVFGRQNKYNHAAMLPAAAPPMGEYDPNRIPKSAFSAKNTSGVDWSVASNESLFSIQTGNASFNRDHHAFLFKSQELPKYDDHMVNPSSRLPQVSENMNSMNGKQDLMLHQAPKAVMPGTLEEPKKEGSTRVEVRLSADASSTPLYSCESKSGMPVFSFPILENADTRNSIGKMSPAVINNQRTYLETPTAAALNNEVVMKFPVAAPTTNGKNWSCFACFRG